MHGCREWQDGGLWSLPARRRKHRLLAPKESGVRIVQITWLDSKGITAQWEFKDDIEPIPPAVCVSVGFLIDETKEYITIVQSDSPEQILGRLTIPRAVIKKRKYLK